MMRVLALLTVLATPVAAFDIDYPDLFVVHTAQVQTATPGERRLELPGPVIVVERTRPDGTRRYSATDQSGLGPAGCGLHTLVNALVVGGACPGVLTDDEQAQIDQLTLDAAAFVGANTHPVVPSGDIRGHLLAMIAARMAQDVICPIEGGQQMNNQATQIDIIRNLARSGGKTAVARMLSQPRLPVCDDKTYPAN